MNFNSISHTQQWYLDIPEGFFLSCLHVFTSLYPCSVTSASCVFLPPLTVISDVSSLPKSLKCSSLILVTEVRERSQEALKTRWKDGIEQLENENTYTHTISTLLSSRHDLVPDMVLYHKATRFETKPGKATP